MTFQECIDRTKNNKSIKLSIDISFININIDNKKMSDNIYISSDNYYYYKEIVLLTYKKKSNTKYDKKIEIKLKEKIYVENTIGNFKK